MSRDRPENEAAVRERLHDVLADVRFPVDDPLAVAAAVDAPHATRIDLEDRSVTAMELAVELEPYQEFPYETEAELVDDVVDALHAEDRL